MSLPAADDVPVVWLAPAEGREDAARSIAEWARARGVRLVPAQRATASALAIDPAVAERAERELARARDAIAALDGDAAERALARAEALLRDHPELPQAAWLRAEVDRAWASRWTRIDPRDDARAAAAWQDAEARDGGRVAGVGESPAPPRAKAKVTVEVHGAGGRALALRVDGRDVQARAGDAPVASFTFEAPPAEHQVVVTLDGEPVFAQWVAVAAGTTGGAAVAPVVVRLSEGGACDATSLSTAAREDGRVRAPGVACPRWIAAVPTERRGAVLVARCEREACGPLLEWRIESGASGSAADGPPPIVRAAWPAWATWALVGVGAAAAGTAALVATGALESRPTEPRFVAGGVRSE